MTGKVRVVDTLWLFFVAVAVIGPLALPLLWRNPRFKVSTKVVLSIAVCLLTIGLMKLIGGMFQNLMEQYQQLQQLNNPGL